MIEWFGLSQCFVLFPFGSVLPSPSMRRILYSALVCAIETLNCTTPAFMVSTSIDALHRSREILGYSRIVTTDSTHTILYESALLENIAPKHLLFYLDGLLQLFTNKLQEYSNMTMGPSSGLCVVRVCENYFYKITENDRFLTRSVAFNNDSKKLLLHPEIQSTIEDLAAAFPDRDDTSASLNKLIIKLDYGLRKSGNNYNQEFRVDDNEFYTTLRPSLLSHDCWEVEAEFLPLRNGSDLEPQGLAHCLRQLLALYIAGKCCQTGQSVINMSGKNGGFPAVDRAKALSIANVLSIRSRDAVSAVCTNSPSEFWDDNGNFLGGSGNIPQDLLMRVFSRSLWIDVPQGDSGFDSDDITSQARFFI